ncbi:MAG: MBL fold metallo-hydrolase [Deltaproteobacteria bacterium]|nr:MBL fold metallo-hydrolase [Deltaproteobacteria bacterium]
MQKYLTFNILQKHFCKVRQKIDKVFASHLHSDHVGGFAELYIV